MLPSTARFPSPRKDYKWLPLYFVVKHSRYIPANLFLAPGFHSPIEDNGSLDGNWVVSERPFTKGVSKTPPGGGGALGYVLGGYVPPGTPNWHPVLKKISPKIDTPF